MEKEKLNQSVGILKEEDIDCWLILEQESGILSDPVMDFVIGSGVTWLSFFLVFRSGETYAVVGNLDREKVSRLNIFDQVIPYRSSPTQELLAILNRHNPRTIALNYSTDSATADGLTYGKFLRLQQIVKNSPFENRFVSAEKIIASLRGRKSAEEISRINQAIRITLDIYNKVTLQVQPGWTEKDVASFITSERRKLNLDPAWEEEHCPSVFTGPQENGAHSGPTDAILQRGHVFNIDFGVKVERYCSDLQRSWYILREGEQSAPPEVIRGFNTIARSIRLAFEAVRPGVRGIDIDRIARTTITDSGYTEYPHALGHQVGRDAHDGGALLAPDWERYGILPFIPLEEGQVFTIEPRLYLKKHGVVTVEEMIQVTAEGARWLSQPQQEIYLIK